MVENKTHFADKIDATEVNKLLTHFWGEGSLLAKYEEGLIDFKTANTQLDAAFLLPKDEANRIMRKFFSGKTVSIGIRHGEELVAHSALKVYASGELETTGSIISESFRGKSLMTEINIKKKGLIKKFSLLGYQPISYVLLGSKSVEHGYQLFNIPEVGLTSWFCNIGPYVFNRPINLSKQENDLVFDLGYKTKFSLLSSSSKIIGVKNDRLPLISANVQKYLPKFWSDLLTEYPKIEDDNLSNIGSIDKQNTVFKTSSNVILYTIKTKIKDLDKFIESVAKSSLAGKTVMFEVPIELNSLPALKQILDIISKPSRGITFIPTGLTIVDGYWSICVSTILNKRVPHYINTMLKVADIYRGSLKQLAMTSYNYLLALQR